MAGPPPGSRYNLLIRKEIMKRGIGPAPLSVKKFTKASEALFAAKNLIKDKRRWVQYALAVKTGKGYFWETRILIPCSTKAKNAVAFCALGAVKRINGPAEHEATVFLREAGLYIRYKRPRRNPKTEDILFVNDIKGHKATMKMFHRAILQARKAGK